MQVGREETRFHFRIAQRAMTGLLAKLQIEGRHAESMEPRATAEVLIPARAQWHPWIIARSLQNDPRVGWVSKEVKMMFEFCRSTHTGPRLLP